MNRDIDISTLLNKLPSPGTDRRLVGRGAGGEGGRGTRRASMFFGFAMLLLLAGPAASVMAMPTPTSAGGVVDLWMHQVPRVKTPPVIDGKLDDACWKTLPVLSNFMRDCFATTSTHPMFPITMQLGHDDSYLYCAWRLSNPTGAHHVDYAAWKKHQDDTKHDMPMYWNTPSLAFHIDGRHDRQSETVIQMNMVDQKQAYQTIATGWSVEQNPGFDLWGDYQYASGYDDSGWWVELKVALKDLGVDVRHGYVTGAQFRYFHIASGVWFAWTPAGYSPAGYGHLLLVDEPVSTEQALTLIYPNWRNMTIRMPQADKVVLVDRGQFVETSYQEAVMKELNGLRQKRRQIGQKAASATRLEAKAMFANLDKTLADIEADIAKVGSFNASDMTRLRQPMDNVAFALREAEANVAVKKLLAQ